MSKSAMQEAIELVKEYNNRIIPYNVLLGNLELLLEKEKKQIVNAYNQNMTGFDKLEQEEIGLNWAEQYYNQTYNQNK